MHRVRLRWLLLGATAAAVLLVHRSAAATTPYSRRTVVHDDRTTTMYSGNTKNPTIGGSFKRTHRTRQYHRESFTSNIVKFSSKFTNSYKVNTIGKVWYKRRYTTTTSRMTDFPLNWEVKRVPLMRSCAVSKNSTWSKLSTTLPDTINPYSIVSLAYISKKQNHIRHSERHSNNYIRSTGNSMCTACSKPILPIHTLIKPKLTTTSHVSLKSFQMETTAIAT